MSIKLTSYSEQGLAQFLQSHKETQLTIKVNLKSDRDISYLRVIEDELSQLIHLTDLSITIPDYCVLSQRGYTYISNTIKHLTKLTKLSIQIQGFIQNEELVLFQKSIENLVNLQTLRFKIFPHNDINSLVGQEFVNSLLSLSNLRKLTLQLKGIKKSQTDEGNIHFWRAIQNLQNLEKLALELQECNYGQQDLIELFQHIVELKQLKKWSLISYGNNHPAYFIDMMIFYIGQITNLKSLEIGFEDDKEVFLNNLQRLDLTKNLSNLKQLEKLKMNTFQRQLVQHQLKEYADLIGGLIKLKKLNIECFLGSEVKPLNYLGQSFLNLTNITSFELNLGKNKVYNEFIEDLSISLSSMKNLNSLKLILGDFSSYQSTQLGSSLSKLHNLTILFLDVKQLRNNIAIPFILNNLNNLIGLKEFILQTHLVFTSSMFFEKLINLETLEIPPIRLRNYENIEEFSQIFRNLKQLKILKFTLQLEYQIDQSQVSTLESAFMGLQSLESLQINLVYSNKTKAIAKINLLQHLKNLKKLNINISSIELDVFDLSSSSAITNEYALEEVEVSSEQSQFGYSLSTEVFLKMMDSLSRYFPKLKKLNLSRTLNLKSYSIQQSMQFSTICSQFANLSTFMFKDSSYDNSFSFYFEGIKNLKMLKKLAMTLNIKKNQDIEQIVKPLQKLRNLKVKLITLNQDDIPRCEKVLSKILQQVNHKRDIEFDLNSNCLKLNNIVSFNQEFKVNVEDLQLDAQNGMSCGEQKRIEVEQQQQEPQQKIEPTKKKLFPSNLQVSVVKEDSEVEERLLILSNLDNIDLQYLINLEINQSLVFNKFIFPVNGFNIQLNQLCQLRSIKLDLQHLVLSEEQISYLSSHSSSFKHLVNLKFLVVKIESINDHYCPLLDEFKHLNELTTFELETSLSKGAAISLGNSLKELKNLENCILNIQDESSLGNIGLLSILNGLKGQKNLQKLTLQQQINEEDNDDNDEFISDFFEGMSKLSILKLDWNTYECIKIRTPQLYQSLSQSPYLEVLSIQLSKLNSLNQEMLNQLVNSIGSLNYLKSVNIQITFGNSDDNSSTEFSIANSLSNYLNRYTNAPLIIQVKKNQIEFYQSDHFVFKINSLFLNNLELNFLEALNEKIDIDFDFSVKQKSTILGKIKKCVSHKLRLKGMNIYDVQDANDICEFLSRIPNISILQMVITMDESIMKDMLTQIAHSILKLKSLHTLYLNFFTVNEEDEIVVCQKENLLLVLSIVDQLQNLQELYIVTPEYDFSISVQKTIKKRMKKLVKMQDSVENDSFDL